MIDAEEILLLATGGTIDKVYGLRGELEIGPPAAAALLAAAGIEISIESILSKDSLTLTDVDRATIVNHVRSRQATKLLITHGTDTMTDTAAALLESGVVADRTVVLTGAMRPASMIGSDAAFNLGAAIIAARTLPAGVYIVMHGTVFAANAVAKSHSAGRFVPVSH
ncbi:asparaginase domain-containing protein [Amnibacterium flavum]|uniref:asparaginase domain-containing protein n=1 Tax=Amnibacterium flavum TaxID=2173173 RepID=UPI00196A3456|nr:asparaginase domain-containing protein [Amnibacterium flavum]